MSGAEQAFQQITFWASRGWAFELEAWVDGRTVRYVACFRRGYREFTGVASDTLGATLAVLQEMNRSNNT